MNIIVLLFGAYLVGTCFTAGLEGLHFGKLVFPSESTFGQLLPIPSQTYEGSAAFFVSVILIIVSSPFLFYFLQCHKKKDEKAQHWGIRVCFFIVGMLFFIPFSKYLRGALFISERPDLYLYAMLFAIPVVSSYLVIRGVSKARWVIVSSLTLLSLPAVYSFAKGMAFGIHKEGSRENLSSIPTDWWMYLISACVFFCPIISLAYLVFRKGAQTHFTSSLTSQETSPKPITDL